MYARGHGGRQPIRERFFGNVIVGEPDECWPWLGYHDENGYGKIGVNGKDTLAHRLSYELNKGPIPEGQCVCHACDNPTCVNWNHLWLGTKKDNSLDMSVKKRGRKEGFHGEDHPRAKLTELDVVEIRKLRAEGHKLKEIAERFGVTMASISLVALGKLWSHVPG